MARSDYDEIKSRFEGFVQAWQQRRPELLAESMLDEAACFMSTVPDDPQGGNHGLYNLQKSMMKMKPVNKTHMGIYNFVARIQGNTARQSAIVIATMSTEDRDFKAWRIIGHFSNVWVKTADGWRMSEIRMDVTHAEGDHREFTKGWHFSAQSSGWFEGIHLPVISGDLDSPWLQLPQAEDELTDEERIMEAFAKYAFGIDTTSFCHLDQVFSEDLAVNMMPFGSMDKRRFIETLKIHRMPDRYWIHPVRKDRIHIDGDVADVYLYRVAGHGERHLPYEEENINKELACARYEIKMIREGGQWRFLRLDYYFGGLEIGLLS